MTAPRPKFTEEEINFLCGLEGDRYPIFNRVEADYAHVAVAHAFKVDLYDYALFRRGRRDAIPDIFLLGRWYFIPSIQVEAWAAANLVGEWSYPRECYDSAAGEYHQWTFSDEEDMLLFRMKWL